MPSPAQNKATTKYVKTNYDTLTLRFRKDSGAIEKAKKRAEELGISMSEYMRNLIDADINK